ncbi:MAG: hypothetical protein Q9180_005043 [Flavoplaca navasiana]
MSTPFRFGFVDDDMTEDNITRDNDGHEVTNSSAEEKSPAGAMPCLHTLDELLASLPYHIEYKTITIPSADHGEITLGRRELFDIRAQLMAEDTALDDSSAAGLLMDDIKPNVYEGGFKTWECSVDLARYLANQSEYFSHTLSNPCTIVELGAGTALPSQLLLHLRLFKGSASNSPRTTLVLADFNASVLKLATIPNILLNYQLGNEVGPDESGGDVDVFDQLGTNFQNFLRRCNVEIKAISGSWGTEFSAMALPETSKTPDDILILASETIYSPASTRAFTSTLLDLLHRCEGAGGKARALVAAKRVYFGVGGSVDDFLNVLRELGGEAKVVWTTDGLEDSVGRCILEVTSGAKEAITQMT